SCPTPPTSPCTTSPSPHCNAGPYSTSSAKTAVADHAPLLCAVSSQSPHRPSAPPDVNRDKPAHVLDSHSSTHAPRRTASTATRSLEPPSQPATSAIHSASAVPPLSASTHSGPGFAFCAPA